VLEMKNFLAVSRVRVTLPGEPITILLLSLVGGRSGPVILVLADLLMGIGGGFGANLRTLLT